MNQVVRHNLIYLLIILCACFFILFPLLRPGFPVTDDGDWMIIRLSAFYQSFREGQFPVRFLGRFNNSYGYPVANFLYPGLLYIGSVLHVVGLSFQDSIKGIIIGSVLIGAFATFFWLRRFFHSYASTIGAVSFLFMPYILYDIYKRGSVGEILAIGISIMIIYAIENKTGWIIAPLIAFLITSHNTLALFFVPVLFGYILIKRYNDFIPHMLLGVGIAAFFWIPALFERKHILFSITPISDPLHYFSVSHILILYGLPILLIVLITLFQPNKRFGKEKIYFIVLILGSTILASEVSLWLWRTTWFVNYIQFPYRFFAIGSLFAPWFIAYVADDAKSQRGILLAIIASGVLILLSLPYQGSVSVVRPEGFYSTNEATTTVRNEYMPRWVSYVPAIRKQERIEVFNGNAKINIRLVTTEQINAIIHAKEESILQINTIYYPGWGAMIDNKPVAIQYDNPSGFMRITVPSGDHTLYMAFRETIDRFIADIISVCFVIVYLVWFVRYLIYRKVRLKRKRR